MTSHDDYQFEPNIIELAQNNSDVLVLWLYGSRAKGNARPDSDYDLAIAFKQFPKDITERRLRPELLAIDWSNTLKISSEKISIVDINLAPISLAWEIIRDGKVLFANDPLRQVREELRISSMYELDLLYHRRKYAA